MVIIDQTLLPGTIRIVKLKSMEEMWNAIYLLQVRGAPAIGVAAGFAMYLAAKQIAFGLLQGLDQPEAAGWPQMPLEELLTREQASYRYDLKNVHTGTYEAFLQALTRQKDYLNSSRPTAVNLSWALNRMERVACAMKEAPVGEILQALGKEAVAIKEEDTAVCKAIGENGLTLVKPGDGILTHCNAGQLATSKYGTATAPIYLGQERGYNFRVFCDETRPLLQGARLTSFELQSAGVDTTLICDNMSAMVMKNGWVNAVFVGCDRVAANGDAANKIGTSIVALVAKHYNVPFYVCAPTSTIDYNIASGADIPIEQRKDTEVTEMWYEKRMAPEGVKVYNPAFDVTDHSLITGIVTEFGVARAPFTESLAKWRHD
ncbi:MAG: S-methyl-5-thioribose-1-phosphate isomerase [Lachnospiraceae bacterium]|nr:S-methyl-5-thioribose-1-phosphate isomerase [Lachnospiraceae bacterium]